MLLHKSKLMFSAGAAVLLLAGCFGEDPVNPEETLDEYIDYWETGQYGGMENTATEETQELIGAMELELEERMNNVYSDIGVDNIQVTYEPIDFSEEEIDLDGIEEITYEIDVQMDTMLGELNYYTDVTLRKETEEEDGDEWSWKVDWHPTHFFAGLQEPDDLILVNREEPERGGIYDRNGLKLAVNDIIYEAGFKPEDMDDFDAATEEFAEILSLDVDFVRERANLYPDNPEWFTDVVRISPEDPRREELGEVSGVMFNRVEGRVYPHGEALAHLIGHIDSVNAEDLEEREGEGYTSSSYIGRRGLEAVLEDQLRGEPGVSIVVANADRETRDVIKSRQVEHGEDITLTIDAEMQVELAEAIGDDAGTGLVMNPATGEVLALASMPAYDSNLRYLNLSDPRAEELEDTNILYQLRFRDSYSPGSVFKPFTAAIGLEEGTLDPVEVIEIDGKQWQPEDSDWGSYEVTRVNENVSEVDLNSAMKHSDNIYFAQQALEIGSGTFEEWAEQLGFGESLDFVYPMHTSTLSNDGLETEMLLADTGYGQGEVLINPLHLTTLYTMFTNEGSVVQPTLLQGEETGVWLEDIVSPDTAERVLESLITVTEDENGTAYRENPGHSRSMAGKTGTAELKESRDDVEGEQLGWYTAFDYEEQDLLVTVMIEGAEEHGGSGYVVDLVNGFLGEID